MDSLERVGDRVSFVEPDSTFCLTNQTFHWFNSTESMPIKQLQSMMQLNSECPSIPGYGNCICEGERMSFQSEDQHLIFTCKVDCSGLGLKELPSNLPNNTISLNISNNNVSQTILVRFPLITTFFLLLNRSQVYQL